MTSPRRPGRLHGVGAWLLALLAAVGLLVFGAGTASARTLPEAGNRVRASAPETITDVGVSEHIAAGQSRGPPLSQPQFVVATGVAADSEASLLAQANAARDAELALWTRVRSADRPATVVGAYNVRTGNVEAGFSSKVLQECAEACAARNVGGDLIDIRFTRAFRPNGSGPPYREIPVCAAYCEPAYGRGAFPDPLTKFQSDIP